MNYKEKYIKYKTKYLELKQKGGLYPDVYLPRFHSMMLHKEILPVPEGCIIVHIDQCGLVTSGADEAQNPLIELFNTNTYYLRDPIENREEIENFLGVKISIHTHDNPEYLNTYMNMIFNLHLLPYKLLNSKEKKITKGYYRKKITCSGLKKMDMDSSGCKYTVLKSNPKTITLEDLLNIYSESIFPTPTQIKLIFNSLKLRDQKEISLTEFNKKLNSMMSESIKLSELMEKYPGIYYISTCRASKKKVIPKSMMLQRQYSYENLKDLTDEDIILKHDRAFIKILRAINNKNEKIFFYHKLLRDTIKKLINGYYVAVVNDMVHLCEDNIIIYIIESLKNHIDIIKPERYIDYITDILSLETIFLLQKCNDTLSNEELYKMVYDSVLLDLQIEQKYIDQLNELLLRFKKLFS